MAARKLQAEIDRTLKTVAQGVELFEQLYDKLQASTNQTQKEKLESDLKTQIKKLQRLRDQIKGWLGNNDIKDKKPLLDNRKLIETQMERFKATEKEMKTKAFSKEGLIAAAKLDPLEKAKMEMSNWLSNQVDELSRQIEMSEAEIEQASSGTNKKSKKGATTGGSNERVSELETLNERRNWHVGRLEILLRMLENGTLEIEDVETIKDDIAYYVESNAEEDFEEDEGIYDEFNLDEEEEAFGLQQNDDILSSHDGASVAEDPPKTPVKESAIAKARRDSEDPTKKEEMDKSSIPSAKKTARKVTDPTSTTSVPSKPTTTEKEKTVPPANFSQAQVKPPVPVSAPTPTSSATATSTTAATAPILSPPKAGGSNQLPPIRYAAAAAAAVSPSAAPPGISPPIQSATAAPVTSIPSDPSSTETKEEDTTIQQQSATKPQISPVPSSIPSAPTSEIKTKEEISTNPIPTSTVGPPPGIGGLSGGPPGLIPRSQSPSQATTSSPSLTYSSARGGTGTGGVQSNSQGSPAVSHSSAGINVAPGSNIEENKENQQQQQQAPLPPVDDSATSSFQPAQLAASSAAAGVVQPLGGGAGTTSQQLQAQKLTGTESRLPSSLSDLVTSFESVKQKSMLLNNQNNSKSGNSNQIYNNLNTLHESLENSFINVPEPIDSEKPKYYIPKNPFNTPGYYPQNPSGIFENPNVYSKFDVDTLFYIFYYQQGTYHQYLAAKELKKQSWRFHKQYLTWFQRHSEPQAITDEYEQGVYVYFDWENSWCQRKKSDFRFEYRWLEEN